jgi:hypothetical protein
MSTLSTLTYQQGMLQSRSLKRLSSGRIQRPRLVYTVGSLGIQLFSPCAVGCKEEPNGPDRLPRAVWPKNAIDVYLRQPDTAAHAPSCLRPLGPPQLSTTKDARRYG